MTSPYSKYSPISVGEVTDNGRYLGMPIPIIKHNNLSGYEKLKVQIVQLERTEKSAPSVTTLQSTCTSGDPG